MRVLLIWEMIPESAEAYVIQDPTQEQLDTLLAANETYIGTDDDDAAALIISTAIGDKADADPYIDEKWHAIWEKCRVEFPVKGPIDWVVITGCAL